ncbi:MAG: GyrI-like domain-containing protein [Bacteroidota bacterium]
MINGLNSDIRWAFKDTVGATKVTIKINGELSFTEKAQALFEHGNIDRTFETGISRGLDNLNVFLVSDLKKFDIDVKDIVLKNGAYYLGHTITSTKAEVNKIAAATFQKLFAFTKKNKIAVAGAPFILYKNFKQGRDTVTYTLSIPIKEEIYTMPGSEYEGGRLMPFNALKTSLRGDYSHLPKAWDAAYKHISEKGLIENPALPYVVNYAKNINDTRRPSNWVSDVYIPIGPALQNPADTLQVPTPELTHATTAPATTNKPATAKPAATNAGTPNKTVPPTTAKPATVKPTTAKPTTAKPATTTTQADKVPVKPKTKPKPAPAVKKDSLKEFR